MITENKVFDILQKNEKLYDPFQIIEITQENSYRVGDQARRLDGKLTLFFKGREYKLALKIKSRTAPKIVEPGISQLEVYKSSTNYKGEILTLLVPYLTESIVEMLEKNNLSGIDLNGNYYLISRELVAIRLDNKNSYRESKYIKGIYSKKSSLVGRLLLKSPITYNRIGDVYERILELGGNITLSTVSKVLSELEKQLIVSKNNGQVKLLQPSKLLERLSLEYQEPKQSNEIQVKLPDNRNEAKKILSDYFGDNWIYTGESSADIYTSAPRILENEVYLISDNVRKTQDFKDEFGDDRFYNYKIIEIPKDEEFVFFDSQNNYASKIQTYLELSQLDKREKEIAEDIKRDILNEFK